MPAPETDPTCRRRSRRRPAIGTVALLAAFIVASSTAATAGPIAESFRRWSMQRQVRTRVEKPFSGQSSTVDLSVRPSAWSRIQSAGLGTAARGAVAARNGRTSLVARIRDRMAGRAGAEQTSGLQQSTEPGHHGPGMFSR